MKLVVEGFFLRASLRIVAVLVALLVIVASIHLALRNTSLFFNTSNPSGQQFYAWLHGQLKELHRKSIGQIHLDTLTSSRNKSTFEQCLIDERDFSAIHQQLLQRWQLTWRVRSARGFATLLTADGEYGSFQDRERTLRQTIDGIEQHRWQFANAHVDKPALTNQVMSYLQRFEGVDFIHMVPISYKIPIEERSSFSSFKTLNTKLRMEIRGRLKTGHRIVDMIELSAILRKERDTWLIESIHWDQHGRTQSKRKATFRDITTHLQLHRVPKAERSTHLSDPEFALAILDGNLDGIDDILVGRQGHTLAWMGDSKGGFTREGLGALGNTQQVRQIVPIQLGSKRAEHLMVIAGPHLNDLQLDFFSRDTAEWQPVSIPHPDEHNIWVLSSFDMNRDGLQDLLVGVPEPSTDNETSAWLTTLRIWQQGPSGFVDVSSNMLPAGKWMARLNQAVAVDLDRDGWQDILVISNAEQGSDWLRNEFGKGFSLQGPPLAKPRTGASTVGLAMLDLDQDEDMDLVTVHRHLSARQRLATSCQQNWNTKVPGAATYSRGTVRVWQGSNSGNFLDVSKQAGIDTLPYYAQSVSKIDYNSDGLVDLFITTGAWSGQSAQTELDTELVLFAALRRHHHGTDNWPSGSHGFFRTLSEVRIKEHIPGLPMQKVLPSLAGHQPNLLLRNNGNGTFTEVGYHEGLDSVADGYLGGVADINGDSRPDLILRNRDSTHRQISEPMIQVFINARESGPGMSLSLGDATPRRVILRHQDIPYSRYHIRHAGNFQNSSTWIIGKPARGIRHLTVVWHDQSRQTQEALSDTAPTPITKRLVISSIEAPRPE